MSCPKCCGFIEGPEWERTDQGYVYTIHCLNCGFRVNDCFVRQLDSKAVKEVKKIIKQEYKKQIVTNFSKYDFGDEEVKKA